MSDVRQGEGEPKPPPDKDHQPAPGWWTDADGQWHPPRKGETSSEKPLPAKWADGHDGQLEAAEEARKALFQWAASMTPPTSLSQSSVCKDFISPLIVADGLGWAPISPSTPNRTSMASVTGSTPCLDGSTSGSQPPTATLRASLR